MERRGLPLRCRSSGVRKRLALSRLAVVLGVLVIATPAQSQITFPLDRPGDVLPELPAFAPSPSERGDILPPVELPRGSTTESLEAGREVFVGGYRLSGNTVIASDELLRLTEPYSNRTVSFAELAALRDRLTSAYVERGYITSGAVIPPQSIDDGIVLVLLVEGELTTVQVETDGRLREDYIRRRALRSLPPVVNVGPLEQQLQILRQNRRIENLQASLAPAAQRGQSVLRLQVSEARPYRTYLELSNYESPTVGAERGLIDFVHTNVLGFGDQFAASYRGSEGLHGVEASYEVPLSANDTTLDAHVQYTRSKVIEEPFDALDIKSRSETYGVTLRHPLYRTVRRRFDVFLAADYRRSESFLLGSQFSFSEGVEDGVAKVAVLRFGQSLVQRGQRQALSARSTFSLGLDALGATHNSGDLPDGQFFSWLGQFQWARRWPQTDLTIAARGAVQLSNSPLLGMEQFAIGGHASVRGYRENALVRDNGAAGSVELRVPVLGGSGASRFELRPFVDGGRGWNDGDSSAGQTLWSAGVGVHWAITDTIHFDGFWAEALRDVPDSEGDDLQDNGVQLRISATF